LSKSEKHYYSLTLQLNMRIWWKNILFS